MRRIYVGDTARQIVPAHDRQFLHIHNADAANPIFLKWDNDDATLTTSNGFQLQPGASLFVHEFRRNLLGNSFHAIAGSGLQVDVRLQGVGPDEDLTGEITQLERNISAVGGGVLTEAHRTALRNLMKAITASTANTKLDFIWPMVGSNAKAAGVALRNFPGRSLLLTPNGITEDHYSPTGGFDTDGDAAYFDMHFQQADLTINDFHLGASVIAIGTGSNRYNMSSSTSWTTTDTIYLGFNSGRPSATAIAAEGSGFSVQSGTFDTDFIIGMLRSADAANCRAYGGGGTLDSANTQSDIPSGADTNSFLAFARNDGGTPDLYNDGQQSIFTAGFSLTDAECVDLNTAAIAYDTEMGRR